MYLTTIAETKKAIKRAKRVTVCPMMGNNDMVVEITKANAYSFLDALREVWTPSNDEGLLEALDIRALGVVVDNGDTVHLGGC